MTTHDASAHSDLSALLSHDRRSGHISRAARWIVGLGIAVLVTAVAVSMRTKAATPVVTYRTEPLARGTLSVAVSATGNLQPTNTVNVGSELSGLVDAVLVDENDTVAKGQVLARLDTAKLRDQILRSDAALASAQAKLAQADATTKEAAAALERLREVSRLSGGKVPSKTEMDGAEATFARAEAEQLSMRASVNEARAALNTDQTNLSKASIRSPIAGVVLTRSVEPGQAVAASLQVATLFTIAEDLREMELQVDVDEADVGSVTSGQRATFSVDAYPSRRYTATVARVAFGSQTSAGVVSYPTLLQVKNDDLSLRPGMTASAEIATVVRSNVWLVPNAALRYTPPATTTESRGLVSMLMPRPPGGRTEQKQVTAADGTKTLWVLRAGQPVAIAVTVGSTDGRVTEVTGADLADGLTVIVDSGSAQS
jgi:HlyD family secretion protein